MRNENFKFIKAEKLENPVLMYEEVKEVKEETIKAKPLNLEKPKKLNLQKETVELHKEK